MWITCCENSAQNKCGDAEPSRSMEEPARVDLLERPIDHRPDKGFARVSDVTQVCTGKGEHLINLRSLGSFSQNARVVHETSSASLDQTSTLQNK